MHSQTRRPSAALILGRARQRRIDRLELSLSPDQLARFASHAAHLERNRTGSDTLPRMESVADGVWRVTRGFPLRVNAFLISEGDGVAVFDSGIKSMGKPLREAADSVGGATRVILGNAHPDHRGGAKAIGVPVHCHPDERADVEGTEVRTTSTTRSSPSRPTC